MRILLFISCFAVLLAGCSQRAQPQPQDVAAECDRLYQVYLNGGQDEARLSLLDAIHVIESAKLSPKAEAHGLWLGYGRLFVLEKRAGSNDVAMAALEKARYWCLRKAEISGDPPAEARAYAEKFACEDGLTAFIDKWDENHTAGRGARYIQRQ